MFQTQFLLIACLLNNFCIRYALQYRNIVDNSVHCVFCKKKGDKLIDSAVTIIVDIVLEIYNIFHLGIQWMMW